MNLSYISKLVFVTIYLLCMIAQILIPSYFGSLLIDKSMKTTQAIYFSKWMNYDEKWKKSYIIFVERTLRAISILAGGLFILSLPTFLTVCIFILIIPSNAFSAMFSSVDFKKCVFIICTFKARERVNRAGIKTIGLTIIK